MTAPTRQQAEQFIHDWFMQPEFDQHGQPVAACERQLLLEALVALLRESTDEH